MIFKLLSKNVTFISLFVISIFVLDRVSKIYIIHLNQNLFGEEIFTSKFLNIILVWNQGIAFGLFSFNQSFLYNLLTLIISIVALVIFVMMIRSERYKKYSLAMIFGVIFGTYSSIYIANTVLVRLRVSQKTVLREDNKN